MNKCKICAKELYFDVNFARCTGDTLSHRYVVTFDDSGTSEMIELGKFLLWIDFDKKISSVYSAGDLTVPIGSIDCYIEANQFKSIADGLTARGTCNTCIFKDVCTKEDTTICTFYASRIQLRRTKSVK